jgi:hypothetical protein
MSQLQFTVGFRLRQKTCHVAVEADDALIAALKVKMSQPEAHIMYVRRQNRRGDARNPADPLHEGGKTLGDHPGKRAEAL